MCLCCSKTSNVSAIVNNTSVEGERRSKKPPDWATRVAIHIPSANPSVPKDKGKPSLWLAAFSAPWCGFGRVKLAQPCATSYRGLDVVETNDQGMKLASVASDPFAPNNPLDWVGGVEAIQSSFPKLGSWDRWLHAPPELKHE